MNEALPSNLFLKQLRYCTNPVILLCFIRQTSLSLFSFLRDSVYVLIQLIISKKLKVSSYTLYLEFCKKFHLCIKVWFLSGFGRWNSFRVQQKVYTTVLRSIYIWFAPYTRLYIFFLKLVVLGWFHGFLIVQGVRTLNGLF